MALKLGELFVSLTARTGAFEKNLTGALKSGGKRATKFGKTLSTRVTAPLLGLGIASVKAFADFDDAMTKSTAIMGELSDDTMVRMQEAAKDVARTTTFSATDAAEAFFFLASAGFDAEQSIASLGQVSRFAQAGAFDLATATDLLTDAQSALGLSVDDTAENMANMARVSDVLVKANTISNATVEEFSRSLTNKAAAAARIAGEEIEDVVAVLAAFADQGIKGQRAGEAYSIVLRELTRRASENAVAFKEANVAVFDSAGNLRDMADIVGDLEKALAGQSTQQANATIETLGFTAESADYIKALIGSSDAIKNYETDLRAAGDITQEVADNQLKSFSAQMKLAKDNIGLVAIEIGQILAPTVLDITEKFVDWTKGFSELDPEMQSTTIKVGLLVAAVGPLLIGVGFLASALGTTAGAITAVALAGVGLGTWANSMIGKIPFLTTLVGGLFDAMVALKNIVVELFGGTTSGLQLVGSRFDLDPRLRNGPRGLTSGSQGSLSSDGGDEAISSPISGGGGGAITFNITSNDPDMITRKIEDALDLKGRFGTNIGSLAGIARA